MSSSSEPVGMTSQASATRSPIRMTEPLPNCFSIWLFFIQEFFNLKILRRT
jgi:hypothetical protein